jgi:multidrug efflux pump subunit AcrA (membrane-fusion protein)
MKRRPLVVLGTLAAAPVLALLIASAVTRAHTLADASMAPAATPTPATMAITAATTVPAARPVLLTGEVETLDSQTVFVPPSNSSPVVLRNFLPEGSRAKAGDVVLRIDIAGGADIGQLKAEVARTQARVDSETATLDVAAVEAEKTLVSARAALAKARVDAALPRQQVAPLNYDRYQAEADRATRDFAIKQEGLQNARRAVVRRREDGALEVKKLQINEAFQIAQLAQAQVRAAHDGVVVHGYSPFNGERMDEGASAFPGNAVGTVLGNGQMAVKAWVLEADRPYLHDGQVVALHFDALPGVALDGTVASITSAPEARPRWGLGRYFQVRINLPRQHGVALVAGMSVLVEPKAAAAGAQSSQPAQPSSAGAVTAAAVEGEIASRRTMPVAPPAIPFVWQYKLASLAPEGMMIEAGQPIAVFESDEVRNQLVAQQGTLKERERALEKLLLDQAEADRTGVLAQAEARSNAEKAERKAGQPKEAIRRVDYDKLVIERSEKAQLVQLMQSQYAAQQRARRAERAGLEADVAQRRAQIAALLKGQAALTILAPYRGLVLYRSDFNGRKYSAGNQVWMGMSVATLADADQLCVDARVPEAQAAGVRVGQGARVTVTGARQSLAARVSTLGDAFHGKSATQSGVVRDIRLQFDAAPNDLKPGAAVQVELLHNQS